jgi:hypothetical protein
MPKDRVSITVSREVYAKMQVLRRYVGNDENFERWVDIAFLMSMEDFEVVLALIDVASSFRFRVSSQSDDAK